MVLVFLCVNTVAAKSLLESEVLDRSHKESVTIQQIESCSQYFKHQGITGLGNTAYLSFLRKNN